MTRTRNGPRPLALVAIVASCGLAALGCTEPPSSAADGGASGGGGADGAALVPDLARPPDVDLLPPGDAATSSCSCPLNFYCDLPSGTCKPGCAFDANCPAGQWCDVPNRVCKPGCRDASECTTTVAHALATCDNHQCSFTCDRAQNVSQCSNAPSTCGVQAGQACTTSADCCVGPCIPIFKVCCLALKAGCAYSWECCSGNCSTITGDGNPGYCF